MEAETYHEYAPRDGVRPPWHAGDWGRRWWQGFGTMLDGVLQGVQRAMWARFPSKAPEDALPLLGRARGGFEQSPGESTDQFRSRLLKAWRLWQMAGTGAGIIYAFNLLGLSNVSIREALNSSTWGRYTGTAKQRWFTVIVDQPHPFGTDFSFRYGDGTTYGSGKLYGATGDVRMFEIMRRLVRLLKPAHAHCPEVIIVLQGAITDGTGTVADGDPATPAARVAYMIP